MLGVQYINGLYAQPTENDNDEVLYDLRGRCTRFVGIVALDDLTGVAGGAYIQVSLDGDQVSNTQYWPHSAIEKDFPVSGVTSLGFTTVHSNGAPVSVIAGAELRCSFDL